MEIFADPGMRAGWEPDTPPDDTLLRRFLLNWAEATALPVERMGGRVLARHDVRVADLGRPSGFQNVAVALQPLHRGNLAEVMAATESVFGDERARGLAAVFSPWPTPDLRPFGYGLAGHPPLMILPAGAQAPAPPDGLALAEVEGEAGLRAFAQVLGRGYPLPGFEPAHDLVFDTEALALPGLRLWVGQADGEPVTASAAYSARGLNHVLLVATDPAVRGRGYGAAATWAASLADPVLPAMLLASDDGRPVYERMGYLPLLRFTCWARMRG